MPLAEPPCGACCYACTDGRTDLAVWAHLPEVVVRAVVGLAGAVATGTVRFREVPGELAVRLIEGYRERISPRTAARCRFTPTCSAYGLAAMRGHGVRRGCRMTWRRLARCRASVPFGTPDPVPTALGRGDVGQPSRRAAWRPAAAAARK